MAGIVVVPTPPRFRWEWLTVEGEAALNDTDVVVARGPAPPGGGFFPEFLGRVSWVDDPFTEILSALADGRRVGYLARETIWSDPVVERLTARPDLGRWIEIVPGPWREASALDSPSGSGAGPWDDGRDPPAASSSGNRPALAKTRVPAARAGDAHRAVWPGRPLRGTVLVALREGEGSRRGLLRLARLGAETAIYPLLELGPVADPGPVDQVLAELEGFDWVVFTSGEAVKAVFDRLGKLGADARRFRGKLAAVGPATAAVLERFGLRADLVSAVSRQEGLAASLVEAEGGLQGRAFLLPGGNLNRAWLGEELERRGAKVTSIAVYENRPRQLSPEARARFRRGEVDGVLFSSASTVFRLRAELGDGEGNWLFPAVAFSIGPETTRALQNAGIAPAAEARTPNWTDLVEATALYWMDRGLGPSDSESEE